jgi:hypothetical protein
LRWTEESGTGGVGMEIDGSNRHGRKKEESVRVKMKRKVGNLIVFFIWALRLFFFHLVYIHTLKSNKWIYSKLSKS